MTLPEADQGFQALASTSWSVILADATLPDNPISYVNPAFTVLCGYTLEDAVGQNCRFLCGRDTDPAVSAEIRAAISAGSAIRREILNYRKDGTPFWNDLAIDPIRDAAGRLTGFVGIQRQADATRFAAQDKAEAESRLAHVADRIPGHIYQRVMRSDGSIEIVYCSPSFRKLLGVPESEAIPRFYEYIHPDDRPALLAAIRSSAANMSMFREEFRVISADGSVHWLRSDAPPRRMANGEIVWDGLAIEIAAETIWTSEITNQALRDPATGLLTRTAARQGLAGHLRSTRGDPGRWGVIHIDITEFRDLNDRVGQSSGDYILRETARRLARIAASIGGVAARLGGDEFAVLAPACANADALSSLASSISEALAVPIEIASQQLTIRTSIGAALCRELEEGEAAGDALAAELITQAELALRWAKQEGSHGFMLYSPEQDDRFHNESILARSLEQAIANDELVLHYQPLVDITSGRIVSAEALVRWNHPTLGLQRPDLFIPLAEKLGLVGKLGHWVLERTLRQRREWENAGLSPPPIAINMSGNQLLGPGFIADVEALLSSTGADAKNFEFELTEGLLIEPSPQVMESLHALRNMGFTLAIDDFGSGHATFRYLRDFPIDKLKIDQLFVRKLVVESTDALIIRAVISLARSMKVTFVAEGIETEMQRRFLEREGCRIGQGFLFSMPLVAEDFGWMLANDVRLPLHAPQNVKHVGPTPHKDNPKP